MRGWLIVPILLVVVAGAVVLLLPGGETSENIVVVYSPHGEDMLNDFKKRFEAAHPDIKMVYQALPGQDVKNRIRAEGKNSHCDVWWGGGITDFVQVEQEGLLEPYKPTWADKVEPSLRSSKDLFYPQWLTPEVIIYNSDALKPEEAPSDWDDLLDDKWKDQIVIRFPLKSSTMKTIYSAMIYRFYKEDKKPDRGYDWLRKLDANTLRYADSPTTMHQMLTAKQGLVTLWNMPDAILYREGKEYQLPLAYKLPKSGTPVLADCIALVKGAPHMDNAKLFYEFVTSAESLVYQANPPYGRIPARKDVPREQLPKWMSEVDINAMALDWDLFVREQDTWMQYWDDNIRGKKGQ